VKRILVEFGPSLQGHLLATRQEAEARGLSYSKFVNDNLHFLLRRLESKELAVTDLTPLKREPGERVYLRVDNNVYGAMAKVCNNYGVKQALLVRYAVILSDELQRRAKLEDAYAKSGEPGSPRFLSDTFLQLWYQHTFDGGRVPDHDTRLFAALRNTERRLADLIGRVEQLEVLREYATLGLRNARTPPSREALANMTLVDLRKTAELWGFPLPPHTTLARARRLVLSHFKY